MMRTLSPRQSYLLELHYLVVVCSQMRSPLDQQDILEMTEMLPEVLCTTESS
jgi:hypothetical protein